MNAPITTDSMSDTNNINVISENSYEFSKESKRKRLAEIALSVDQYMSTRPPLPLSYLVINTFDDEVEIEGLFSNNEAATAYITRLAVNMSVHLYPERVEECNGVMNEESFYEFVDEFIAKNYKKIILTHLDVSKPVYQIVDQDDNYLYDEPTEYLTNSVAKWKSNYPPDQLSSDPEFLEDCTIEIDPAIPKLLTKMSADLEQKINTSKTEPAGIVSGSEEDYVSPATKEKRAIFNNILKNVSEKLDNTSSRSYLVINTVDGLSVEAIFSSHEAAEKYLNRIAINFSTDLYCENCKDAQTQPTEDGFLTFVREMISDNYKILHVHHLDLSNKVYKVQNGNYLCYGETSKYLKNSVEEWKAENISRFGTCANSFNKDWLEQCTVKINPPLPELQCNYY